jgi:hypothetical protein
MMSPPMRSTSPTLIEPDDPFGVGHNADLRTERWRLPGKGGGGISADCVLPTLGVAPILTHCSSFPSFLAGKAIG